MSGGQDPSDPFNEWMNGYIPTTIDEEYAGMVSACSTGDPERDNALADEILCKLLKSLGYTKTVEAFEKLKKWYA